MKIFVLYARENWITDVLYREWMLHNKEIHTTNIHEADTIWVLSHYIIGSIPKSILESKRVITTIHHIVPWKVDEARGKLYQYVESVTDVFHSICATTTMWLRRLGFTKRIITIPFWNNEHVWRKIDVSRTQFAIKQDVYLVGSFQRDTEGGSIPTGIYSPKLEKGPDIFIEAVKVLRERHPNLQVVLSGRCRQFVMKKLDELKIIYHYFEMCDAETLNMLYNILDLYIVGSRIEGGPRAVNEASLTQTPLYTTDVGIVPYICHPDSIYDDKDVRSILKCRSDIEWNYEHAMEYSIQRHMKRFTRRVFNSFRSQVL